MHTCTHMVGRRVFGSNMTFFPLKTGVMTFSSAGDSSVESDAHCLHVHNFAAGLVQSNGKLYQSSDTACRVIKIIACQKSRHERIFRVMSMVLISGSRKPDLPI
jgi:hypothetical protein